MIDELRKVIKRIHYPLEVMPVCVRRHAAYLGRSWFSCILWRLPFGFANESRTYASAALGEVLAFA